MDLQADEAFWVGLKDLFVSEVGHGLVVDEGLNASAFGDDAELVPVAIFHVTVRVFGGVFFVGFGGEPVEAGGLTVDPAGLSWAGFDLALRSVNAAWLIVFFAGAFGFLSGTNLDAGVEGIIDFDFELKFEIGVEFVGAKEGVGAALASGADNGAVHDFVGGGAIKLSPTGKTGAIEQADPVGRVEDRTGEESGG